MVDEMHYRPHDFFRGGGSEVQQGKACKGSPRGGFRGRSPPDAGEIFQKSVKKSMKKLKIFKNFKKISRFFQNFFQNFIEFLAKILTKIQKSQKYAFVGGSGGGAPRRQRIYGNLSRKTNGKLKFLDSSNGTFPIFSKFLKNFIEFFAEIVPIIQENMVPPRSQRI